RASERIDDDVAHDEALRIGHGGNLHPAAASEGPVRSAACVEPQQGDVAMVLRMLPPRRAGDEHQPRPACRMGPPSPCPAGIVVARGTYHSRQAPGKTIR